MKKTDQLTLFAEGFLVKDSPQPENAEVLTTTAISGLKCFESYGSSARLGSLLKTLLASSAWTAGLYSNRYTLTWKAKATKFNRLLFQLSVSERRTAETGFGLLLTPSVVMTEEHPERYKERTVEKGYNRNNEWPSLASQVKHMGLLPTPAAQPPGAKNLTIVDKDGNPPQSHNERWYDQKTGRLIQKGLTQVIDNLLPTQRANKLSPQQREDFSPNLATIIEGLLPTPTDSMATMEDLVQAKFHSSKRPKYKDALLPTPNSHNSKGATGYKNQPDLTTEIEKIGLIPTPRASEYKGTGPVGSKSHEYRLEKGYLDATIQEAGKSTGMKLQPNFVEFLMGYPQNWTIPNGGWSTKQLATTGAKKLDDALELIARKLATVSTEPKD